MPAVAGLILNVLIVLLLLILSACLAVVCIAVLRGGRREDPLDEPAFAASRFVLPVSVVVPVSGAAEGLSATVSSLLALNYPQLEVIVIGDETRSESLRELHTQWALSPREYFYRRTIDTASVRRILATPLDSRLKVVHKDDGGRADALNCGVSLARYRYVATVGPDVLLEPNALLRLMAPALRDPAGVAAATAHVERRWGPWKPDVGALRRVYLAALGDWQWIASVRWWMAGRIAISRLRCALAPQDTVAVWRRDLFIESGGFSRHATDPELDLLLRLHLTGERRQQGHVIRTEEIVGRTYPTGFIAAGRRARSRNRAVIEASLQLAHDDGPRHARIGAWCLVFAEFVTPVAQVVILLSVLAGAAAGLVPWRAVALLLAMLAFGNAAITAAALLMRGAAPEGPTFRDTLRLLALAPAEYVIYRPAVAISRVRRSV